MTVLLSDVKGELMIKIGMLCSGGDCQALNAAMNGVAKALYFRDPETKIYGFVDGYKGMINNEYRLLSERDFSGIMVKGGTILGTSRTPFKDIEKPTEDGIDKVEAMIKNYKALQLDCLVVLGGNGTHKTANLLMNKGLNVVTLPKTIDNDLAETDMTFGFQSAVDIATNAIDCIHTTAASHSRVFIVEIMGHKTGWLTLYAGIAGGADVVLIPEIPYDIESVCAAITRRANMGKKFTIIAAAEGAISKEEAALDKKELKALRKREKYPSVSYKIGAEILERTGHEVRVTVPGHVQRGGAPDAYDRVLASRLGAFAAGLIIDKDYGNMVGLKGDKIVKIPLSEVAGKTKMVNPDSDIVMQAKSLGISLGD